MPDSASLEMPGGQTASKGIPQWVMIVGSVAGVVGLILLLKGSGGGGGTTAAGTSINAALGSIQEENMNLLGVTQAGFMQTGQQIASTSQQTQTQIDQGFTQTNAALTSGFLNTQNQLGDLGTQMGAGFNQTYGLLGNLEHDISQQITAFSTQTQNNFNATNGLIQSGQASQAQIDQANMNLLQSIQDDVKSGLVGQSQANGLLNTIISGQVYTFYSMPNRYNLYYPIQGNTWGWGTPGVNANPAYFGTGPLQY